MRIILILLILTSCTNHLQEVNNHVNSYKYMFNGHTGRKTPEQFYKDGGGSCIDFARTKQAELGGEIVILPELFIQNNQLVTHAVLKVDGWLLDSRFNGLQLAAFQKTYPYKGE